jgi:hypothetical protein
MRFPVIVFLAACLAPSLSFAASHGKKPKIDHKDLVDGYALAIATSVFAEKNCPDLKANMVALLNMRMNAQIQDTEEPYVDAQLAKHKSMYTNGLAEVGRAKWCEDADNLFGASGAVVRGLVMRR